MEPGLFLTAGSPDDVVTRFGNHFFMADGTSGLLAIQEGLWNLLAGPVVDTEGLEGPKVLVEHFGLRAAGKVVIPLTFLITATHCCSSCTTFETLESPTPLDFL